MTAREALREHWPEYAIEAAGLGAFMVSASALWTLLFAPGSPVAATLTPHPFLQRLLMGLAMGLTAASIIYSPFGKRSGAHLNPAVTLTFYRLGKVKGWDALFYGLAQVAGGLLGVVLAASLLGDAFRAPPVRFVATLPGPGGVAAAFVAEVAISFGLMLAVLAASNSERLKGWTGVFAASLVATYITLESPISGMSMNPARSLASAAPAGLLENLWVYFTAPPLGMALAARAYARRRSVGCAKLIHADDQRCIFCGRNPAWLLPTNAIATTM